METDDRYGCIQNMYFKLKRVWIFFKCVVSLILLRNFGSIIKESNSKPEWFYLTCDHELVTKLSDTIRH